MNIIEMNLSSLKIFEISSASLPAGNQVDGIPPASSLEIALPDQVLVWFRAPVLDPFIKNENHPNSLVAVGVFLGWLAKLETQGNPSEINRINARTPLGAPLGGPLMFRGNHAMSVTLL